MTGFPLFLVLFVAYLLGAIGGTYCRTIAHQVARLCRLLTERESRDEWENPDLSVYHVPWYRLDKRAQGYRFRYRQCVFDYLTSGNYWIWVYTTEERRK